MVKVDEKPFSTEVIENETSLDHEFHRLCQHLHLITEIETVKLVSYKSKKLVFS